MKDIDLNKILIYIALLMILLTGFKVKLGKFEYVFEGILTKLLGGGK